MLLAGMTSACSVHPLMPGRVTGAHSHLTGSRHAPPQFPILGVDLYAKGNYPTAFVRRNGRRALSYIKHTLGATSVGIAWNFFEPDIHSNEVRATGGTLTPANVQMLTQMAYAEHLSVEYRPLIEMQAGLGPRGLINPHNWEGFIAPQNQAQWFASYYRAELPYLQIAQRLHVREFVTGSELEFLNSSNLWPSFFRSVGAIYHGIVSYASEQRNYFPAYGAQQLLKLSYYGVDAYPQIFLPPTAQVSQLVAGWDRLFHAMSPQVLYRTALDEVGISATDDAYYHPSLWGVGGKFDETVQARWFTAVCDVVEQYHLRAIYFWNVNLADDPAHPPFPSPPTFEGKPAANSIRGCLGIFHEH
ncbi:MAG TPA: hypothetical protein VGS19_15140 [Streptosporangiaceae bacterium]|nr:hypothetical protein [Streptosporangiaceae bacterium]